MIMKRRKEKKWNEMKQNEMEKEKKKENINWRAEVRKYENILKTKHTFNIRYHD